MILFRYAHGAVSMTGWGECWLIALACMASGSSVMRCTHKEK